MVLKEYPLLNNVRDTLANPVILSNLQLRRNGVAAAYLLAKCQNIKLYNIIFI